MVTFREVKKDIKFHASITKCTIVTNNVISAGLYGLFCLLVSLYAVSGLFLFWSVLINENLN